MKYAIIIALLFILTLAFNARPIDPYQPAPGAYDGLPQEEVEDLEREREASRAIDREVSRSGHDHVMIMEATAYTWTGNKTATGTWPEEGRTVAADPNVLPYGTEISINGRAGYIVEDCGSAIKGDRLDIYMNSRGQALYWGRQPVEVRRVISD